MISRVYVRICIVSHSFFLSVSLSPFFFSFFESCNRISRVRCSPSIVACARRRASAGKVLELKPSVALTKSNNATFHVRRLSRACFRSAQPFDTFFQRTYDTSVTSPPPLLFLSFASASSSLLLFLLPSVLAFPDALQCRSTPQSSEFYQSLTC